MQERDAYVEIFKELEEAKFVGIGSGRTIKKLLANMPSKFKNFLKCVPTSYDTKMELLRLGFRVTGLDSVTELDVAIDGFDSVVDKVAIKGGGGCMTWEKLVAQSSAKLILIGDTSKLERVVPVPVEVLPMACGYVQRQISELCGLQSPLRQGSGKLGPVVTDFGNWILDVSTKLENLQELHKTLNGITGVVETGIFTLPFHLLAFSLGE